ncbi:MAG: hypothetical protein K2M43_02380 [Mycoplasmoidaceae bacterium]|nr:hypothetical protein [Mycoplasmoidaceae bacterium]
MPTQINSKTKKQIIEKIKTLCFPAGGCTEIGGIGYCVAAAAQKYKGNIKTAKHIIVEVSPYIFKNVLKVGVPNLGVCGITMIAAAGAAIANTKHKLELMSYLTPKQIETAK